MRKYKDYLDDKSKEAEKAKEVFPYTKNKRVNELRQLVEDCTKWMSIGSFKQKTPQYMVKEFKNTMTRANRVKAMNQRDREENDQ
tara:strand:- start:23581 stop:23835 length:255 start_codon:yes stop_codon:yes gene_type:complete